MRNLFYKTNWPAELLNRFSITESDFAKKINRPRQSVSQWKQGTRPSIPAIIDICNAFNLKPDFFFEDS
jgi:transcriptional regulator with XRE-family HTH domain